MELIYEKSQAGRRAGRVPNYGLPVPAIPAALARKEPPRLPELAENEIVRHFTNLADRNFGIRVPYFLSLVAPDYAQRPDTRLEDCGVHVFEPGTGFRRLPPSEVARRILFVPGVPLPLLTVGEE